MTGILSEQIHNKYKHQLCKTYHIKRHIKRHPLLPTLLTSLLSIIPALPKYTFSLLTNASKYSLLKVLTIMHTYMWTYVHTYDPVTILRSTSTYHLFSFLLISPSKFSKYVVSTSSSIPFS